MHRHICPALLPVKSASRQSLPTFTYYYYYYKSATTFLPVSTCATLLTCAVRELLRSNPQPTNQRSTSVSSHDVPGSGTTTHKLWTKCPALNNDFHHPPIVYRVGCNLQSSNAKDHPIPSHLRKSSFGTVEWFHRFRRVWALTPCLQPGASSAALSTSKPIFHLKTTSCAFYSSFQPDSTDPDRHAVPVHAPAV